MPLSRRKRIAVITAVAVVGAAGLGAGSAYAASVVRHSRAPRVHVAASHDAGARAAAGPGHADQPALGDPAGSASPGASGTPSALPSAVPSTRTPTPRATKAPTKKPTTPAAPPGGSTGAPAQRPASDQAAIQGVVAQINKLRADNGVAALALSDGLQASTHAHNLLMINGCGLSHQCAGEASLGDRISAQGVTWAKLGENIGSGGKIDNNDTAITAAAEGQTTGMYDEKAPNDGHRQNLLDPGFGHVGVDVAIDAAGNVWMTQDFAS